MNSRSLSDTPALNQEDILIKSPRTGMLLLLFVAIHIRILRVPEPNSLQSCFFNGSNLFGPRGNIDKTLFGCDAGNLTWFIYGYINIFVVVFNFTSNRFYLKNAHSDLILYCV